MKFKEAKNKHFSLLSLLLSSLHTTVGKTNKQNALCPEIKPRPRLPLLFLVLKLIKPWLLLINLDFVTKGNHPWIMIYWYLKICMTFVNIIIWESCYLPVMNRLMQTTTLEKFVGFFPHSNMCCDFYLVNQYSWYLTPFHTWIEKFFFCKMLSPRNESR